VIRVTFLVQFLSALGYLFIRDFAAFVIVATVDMLAMNANQAADGALLRRVVGRRRAGDAEPVGVVTAGPIVEPALLRLTGSTNYR
jgi:hypothetical protein